MNKQLGQIPQSTKDKVIALFLAGNSVNHVVFLINYRVDYDVTSDAYIDAYIDTDVVNAILRERLANFFASNPDTPTKI